MWPVFFMEVSFSLEDIKNPFAKALDLEKNGKPDKAEKLYLELLNTFFDNSAVLAAYGMNICSSGRHGLANVMLQKALERADRMLDDFAQLGFIAKQEAKDDPAPFIRAKKAEILNAIGTCYKHENKTREARLYFDEAQALIPTNADIQNNIATLFINEGNPKDAFPFLQSALNIDPNHAQARWNRSLVNLELGNYKDGWEEYDWGFAANVRIERNYAKEPMPVWDGSKGKRLVVYGEQGIGDEILFASCLKDLIKDSELVVLDCHKRLHSLFCESFPGIDIFPTREDTTVLWPLKPDGSKRYEFDAKVAIGSLPRRYRNNLDDFPAEPYIVAPHKYVQDARERLAQLPNRPNIGIHWVGGHKKTRVEVRSIPLEDMAPIILGKDANFIALQYTECEDEIRAFEAKHGVCLNYWPDIIKAEDYGHTAGLFANLDLVITVCTSAVHLAGAMGIPCWVLTPSRPAWRYRLDLEYMPWYDSVLLFRQERGSVDWQPVIEQVNKALEETMGGLA